jgi:hypothetical protein
MTADPHGPEDNQPDAQAAEGVAPPSNGPNQPEIGTKADWYLRGRMLITALSFLLLGLLVWNLATKAWPAYQRIESHELVLDDVEYDSVAKFAIDAKVDQAKSILTYVIILLGVVWGFLLFKPNAPGIEKSDLPEIIMFVLTNLAVFIHLMIYWYYMQLITGLAGAAAKSHNPGEKSDTSR